MRNLNSSFDYLSKDYKGYKRAMIERLKELMPEYTDLSETDAGIVILELASVGLDILSAYLDSQANESLLVTAELWSSVLKWAKMLSYEPRYASSSIIEQVFKLKKVSDEDTVIPAGTQIMTSKATNETAVYFETTSALTIPAGSLGDETDETGNYLHSVEALQGVSVLGQQIGVSNGSKDQEFKLAYSPVVHNTIEIWSDGVKWTKANNNSFVNSGKDDTHYTVTMGDLNEAIIVFGDGIFGKIPSKDKQIYAYYRVGGGTQGNVAPNTVTSLVVSDSRIDKTFNPYLPKVYGQDRESLKSVKLSAPALSRNTWGALTLTDFSDLILANFPEVKLVKTIRGDTAGEHGIADTTCDDIVIGVVTGEENNFSYEVSAELKEKILTELNTRKLAGINDILFTPITPITQRGVEIVVSLLSGYSKFEESIATKIKEALVHYFDVGRNLKIDGSLDIADVERYIRDNVAGVNFVRIAEITNYEDNVVAVDVPIINPTSDTIFSLFVMDSNLPDCTIKFLETGNTI